jgi:hypothetical protein
MKKITLLLSAVCLGAFVNAQTFSDDFESYNPGDYLGVVSPDWTTWSGTTGGAEDVQVGTANAASGTNSLYFSSTAPNGGPQDVVLPFNQVYNSGNFTFEGNFYVESGKGAYFNLQGTLIVAQVWALDCYMLQDGTLKLSNQGTPYLTANYPVASWFNLRIEMDLTANIWELFIDNVSQGTFANPTGQIGILDLYPVNPVSQGGNDQSGFYVDDIVYNHIPATLPAVNGGVTFVAQPSNIAGLTSNVEATVRNMGSDPITSFDIEYDYNGSNIQESVGPISLASLDTYNHTFATPINVAAGSNNLTVTISNVNGAGQDADANDDSKTITVDPIVPANGKIVVGEEGTGTWCQWCPRGAVYMDLFEAEYGPYWEGIAVHNGDPMAVTEYDNGMSGLISGYPSAVVDRGPDVDPSGMESDFLARLQTPPVAIISNTPTWNAGTRDLQVVVSAEFQAAANNNYRLACVLTEDGVTGSGAGWSQANAYAGGGNGVMGGYELLPNPVPAAQMVYDHVARDIQPAFGGDPASFPAVVNNGETHSVTFNFNLPIEWDENNIHVVGLLIDPNGRIDNAGVSSVFSATGVEEVASTTTFRMYPNPTSEVSFIEINNENDADVQLRIIDLSGKQVGSKDYGMIGAGVQLPIVTNMLESGIYVVELTIDGQISTQRLVVE